MTFFGALLICYYGFHINFPTWLWFLGGTGLFFEWSGKFFGGMVKALTETKK